MKKEALWRGLTSVLAVLLAFLFVMTNVAWGYENLINSALNVTTRKAVESESSSTVDTAFYKSDYGDVNHLTEEDLDRLNADEDAFIVQEMEEGATSAGSPCSAAGPPSRCITETPAAATTIPAGRLASIRRSRTRASPSTRPSIRPT